MKAIKMKDVPVNTNPLSVEERILYKNEYVQAIQII